ncbi:MAG: DUF424 family protein [Candidatus Thermoplasmatota archaeon]|nr:DUF424 family protein [Candidatus Thermoplasmatota archaeon]MCL5785327.1 DUF424 family protein [Candidatus Thermoplasmatota archaeon]
MISVRGEILLSAADQNLIGKEFRDGRVHILVDPEFYGKTRVSKKTYVSSLRMCSIANLVGKEAVGVAVDEGLVDPGNIITISGVPHAQFASMIS